MADQDHRAAVLGQRLDQRVAALDVEMVGRLVEDDQVRRVERGEEQREPRLLPAREPADLGRDDVGADAAGGEPAAQLARRLVGAQALQVLQRRLVELELVDLVLGEVADAELRRGDLAPGHRRQPVGEELRQRRLALAVLAEQRDAVVLVDAEVEARAAPAGRRSRRLTSSSRMIGGDSSSGVGKLKRGDLVLDHRRDRLHPLERLDPALRLARLRRLGAEAVDEALHVGARRVLLALLGDLLLEPRAPGVLEGVVGALVERELAAVEVQDRADRAVRAGRGRG